MMNTKSGSSLNRCSPLLFLLATCVISLSGIDQAALSTNCFSSRAEAEELEAKPKETSEEPGKATLTAEELLEQSLVSAGIEPSSEGIRQYLRSFESSAESDRLTRLLVLQLGDASYEEREDALRKLSALPSVSLDVLKAAAGSNDPEISWRSRFLWKQSEGIHESNFSTALKLISKKRFPGLAIEILFVLQRMNDPNVFKRDAFAAIQVSTSPADWDQLENVFREGNTVVQEVAVQGMRSIAGEPQANRFAELASDAGISDEVKLQAAYGLADLSDRRCLDAFENLLASNDVAVRARSNAALMAITQQNFKFIVYGSPEEISGKVKEWKDWLSINKGTVELHLPLEEFLKRRSYLNGNTLLAQGYKNKVLELGPDGKEVVWEYDAQSPWSAEKLENGNVLISSYRDNKVIEVSPAKEIVWEMAAASVLNVRSLDNGNILMCLYSGNTVQEVNRNKEVVWELKTDSSVADAIRLPNGNTIVATNEKVGEYDPSGKQVWVREESDQAYGVSLTANGTLLIAQLGGKVIELDRETNKIVWQFETSNPVDAFRLDNGNTLITTGTESLEVTAKGETVWQYPGANYGTARR